MKGLLSPGEVPEEGPLGDDLLDLLVAEARMSADGIFPVPFFLPVFLKGSRLPAMLLRCGGGWICLFGGSISPGVVNKERNTPTPGETHPRRCLPGFCPHYRTSSRTAASRSSRRRFRSPRRSTSPRGA